MNVSRGRIVPILSLLALLAVTGRSAGDPYWWGALADHVASYDDNEYARAVQVVTSWPFADEVHAFWGEDAPSIREIHYGHSSDGGNTWSCSGADRVISFPDGHGVDPENCAAAVTQGGDLFVVWSEDVTSTREVHYGISTDNGLTWSSETQDLILSNPASATDTFAPSLVAANDGTIHVVWTQASDAGSIEVFYSRSTDGGSTWSGTSADRLISFPDGNGASSPQIVTTWDGSLVVVWRENGTGGPAIHAGRSTDGGATWSSETADREVSLAPSIITNLAASADPCEPTIHVVYTASFDTASPYHYEVYATSSWDSGVTWSGPSGNEQVSYNDGTGHSASNPDVLYSVSSGWATAVWDETDDLSGTNEIHVSYGGPSWSGAAADEIISFPDGENGYRPSIAGIQCVVSKRSSRDLFGDTFVLWTEFAGGTTDNYEVHVSSAVMMAGGVEDGSASTFALRAVPNPASGPVRIEWGVPASGAPEGAAATLVELFDAGGRCLRVLRGSDDSPAGGLAWDRRDSAGRPVPAGCYFARLRTLQGIQRTVPFVLL